VVPVLYSFRRCPFAIRARLAIHASRQTVELREVILRNKPEAMLLASPKGTVPILLLSEGRVVDESLDIMTWSLKQADPEGWLPERQDDQLRFDELLARNDGSFKMALDRYKYPNRFEGADPHQARDDGARFIRDLDACLQNGQFLLGQRFSLADAAILPFIRQYAHVDRDWFYHQSWKAVIAWLDAFKESERFLSVMIKIPVWQQGTKGAAFGAREDHVV
jgi:glutathione S-transferase